MSRHRTRSRHEAGLPLPPRYTAPEQATFADFGATYREAELAEERARYEERRTRLRRRSA